MSSPTLSEQEWTFLCSLLLGGMKPLAGERTIQSLYYILRGRKANQTLQDVHLYSLYPYYRMFPRLLKEEWEKIVRRMQENGLIIAIPATENRKKPSFQLTEKAQQLSREAEEKYRLSFWFAPFDRADIPEQLDTFWLRLHLLVQTCSYLLENDVSFQPIVQDKRIQRWVRMQLSGGQDRKRWLDGLADELYACMRMLPEPVQEIIVRLFTGVSQSGVTLTQLGMEKQEAPSYILLQLRSGLARMITYLQEHAQQFPLLASLLAREGERDPRLTESASLTYAMTKRGCTIEEIAQKRGIKPSTVEDHLVEIALRCPEWDSSAYLPAELAEQIAAISEKLGTSRLRRVKDQLGPGVSYLQIRLALARGRGSE